MTLCYPTAFAIGFGEAVIRSNLGDVLRVQVPLTGASDDVLVSSCVKPSIQTLDGELIEVPRVDIALPGQANQPVYLNITSKKVMVEPAVKLTIAMTCGAAVQRAYPLLLDYAGSPNVIAAPTAPVVTQEPQVSPLVNSNPETNSTIRGSEAGKSQSHSSRPRHANANPAPTTQQAAVAGAGEPPARKKHHNHAVSGGHDVLKVTSDDIDIDAGLKLSQTLADAPPQNLDQQRLAENKVAQAQFAAILRGEDPLVAAQNEIKRQEQKVAGLKAQLDQLHAQELAKEQKDKGMSPLLVGLIAAVVALFLALAAAVAVAIHRSRKNKDATWWDPSSEQKKNVVDIVDYLQTSAEEGNLDPNPITTVREAGNTEQRDHAEPPKPPVEQEDPTPKFKRMGLPALEDTNSSTFNFFGNRGQSIHIEEISDITQEAEFWMSVNDPHRAIEILEPQSRDENQATPITWLYLLDLYRLVGDENNYTDLRHRFKLKFNAKIPNFHEEVVPGAVRGFEDFPHLIANCCALWHSEDIFGYLESLLVDDREGERVGFDLPVYRDILFLLTICNELKRLKYNPMPKEDNPVKRVQPALEVPPVEPDHLAIKPDEPDVGEYSNSLNFDLLEFKTDHGDKT